MACQDYSDQDDVTMRNYIIVQSGNAFTALFTIEAILKIISMGLIMGPHCYLRDGWNWIDFIVVVLG